MEENKKDVLILAIETSCDETAAAVVKNGREVLSNTIYTQIKLHTLFGGVVPEIASRRILMPSLLLTDRDLSGHFLSGLPKQKQLRMRQRNH